MKNRIQHILKRGKSENADLADIQKMDTVFQQEENEYEIKRHLLEDLYNEEIFETTDSPDYSIMFKRLWAKIEKSRMKQKTSVKWLHTSIKVAVAILLGVFIGSYSTLRKHTADPVYCTAYSPRGSISETVLPDGSIIFLNSDSKIRYSINGEKGVREVFLDGEAWFEVEKNERKPFIVHTPYYNVSVTGTRFNVKAYKTDNNIATTLETGEIIINSTADFNIGEDIILKPGEQIVFNKVSNALTIQKVNTEWFSSWKDNKLVFVNMNLKDLIVLLERKYGVNIEVQDKTILDLHFDGVIKNESIIEILDVIKRALPITYNINGQKVEISIKTKS